MDRHNREHRAADLHGTRLTAAAVYNAIEHDGEEELARRPLSLWWSGLAAGFAISLSVLAKGFLHGHLPTGHWASLVDNLGYALGFIVVILGRMQLFTENTITVVLPVLSQRTVRALGLALRLWAIVFIANIVGTLCASVFIYFGLATADQLHAILTISATAMQPDTLDIFIASIPAGFLVAAIVWMLPNGRGAELWLILLTAYLIGVGEFAHVIVGSVEAFMLMWDGQMLPAGVVFHFLLPALGGNILGGTFLFSLLAYGQVRKD